MTNQAQDHYVALGAGRAAALPGFHALTGSDTTGHIKGKGKSSCFKVFLKAGNLCSCWAWCWCVPIPRSAIRI